MGIAAEQTEMIEFTVNSANGILTDGRLMVDGKEYDLRAMEAPELTDLNLVLALDADLIRGQLADSDLEREVVGFLTYERRLWRIRAELAVRLKKRQIAAIQSEFARRKGGEPPLDDFAFAAVLQVLGQDTLERVLVEARSLHEKFVEFERLRGHRHPGGVRMGKRDEVCGVKIRHANENQAIAHIRSLEKAGNDIGDLVYYPCPWCGAIHVGNDPIRRRNRRRQASKRAKERRTSGNALSQ